MVGGQDVDGETEGAKHVSPLPTINAIEPVNAIDSIHTVDTVNTGDSGRTFGMTVTVQYNLGGAVPHPFPQTWYDSHD